MLQLPCVFMLLTCAACHALRCCITSELINRLSLARLEQMLRNVKSAVSSERRRLSCMVFQRLTGPLRR